MKKFFVILCCAVVLPMMGQDHVQKQILVQLIKGGQPEQLVSEVNDQLGSFLNFSWKESLSAPMRIHLFTWEWDGLSEDEILRFCQNLSMVQVAQFNHVIEDRLTPNDPIFGNQWHHIDPQDNDIDSDLAWDITTGGLTPLGDEIVACVVETQGAKWDQEDILPNHWVNVHETPGNGIDDDSNGYVDDYDGWNVSNNTDNSSNGNHGTQVSSMIGSKGNNGMGVSGVNWDVKLMQVQMGGITEASVIAAYTYPLVMRQLYNNTNGAQGAFVVVTNSSWGIDNALANNYPLWCAMYDTLGHYGILSCAATANNNVNVDNVGDMPTTCPSDYLIAVTATNNSDVRTFSGYGTTHIDLGAPGESVMMAGNNGYSASSGTSFSSPCVAGAVALMYSAPCQSLAQIAHANPAEAAGMVKNYILSGIDPVANLVGEVLTGGRLNVNNSLNLILGECVTGDCPPPFSISDVPVPASADRMITWSSIGPGPFEIQYRVQGDLNWSSVSDIQDQSVTLSNLMFCSSYEFQVRTVCDTLFSDWSPLQYFTTDGCCVNPTYINVTNTQSNLAVITWNPVLAASAYTILLIQGTSVIGTYETDQTTVAFDGLLPCIPYTATVTSICVGNQSPVESVAFTTLGCATCQEVATCTVGTNDATGEWIANVTLASINNSTESDLGYGDYTGVTTDLMVGQGYAISVTPGFGGFSYNEYVKAWIDWNGDGIWTADELIFDPGQASSTTATGNFTVPLNATLGSVRLRVGMTYYGTFGTGEVPDACGAFGFGEFEDYCVQLIAANAIGEQDLNHVQCYPNPAKEEIHWQAEGVQSILCFDATGKCIQVIPMRGEKTGSINVSNWPAGVYWLKWITSEGVNQSKIMVSGE
ncbi:MAG: hypothetical protein RLY35_1581 [Bacteroidota bacterium]|jgi:hypothetical protein